MDSETLLLTGNTETVYGLCAIDLERDGPVVVEAPPMLLGGFSDLWQRELAGIGPTGADGGKGGKFLLLPPGHDGPVPGGYIVAKSSTFAVVLGVRGFQDGDGAGTAVGADPDHAGVPALPGPRPARDDVRQRVAPCGGHRLCRRRAVLRRPGVDDRARAARRDSLARAVSARRHRDREGKAVRPRARAAAAAGRGRALRLGGGARQQLCVGRPGAAGVRRAAVGVGVRGRQRRLGFAGIREHRPARGLCLHRHRDVAGDGGKARRDGVAVPLDPARRGRRLPGRGTDVTACAFPRTSRSGRSGRWWRTTPTAAPSCATASRSPRSAATRGRRRTRTAPSTSVSVPRCRREGSGTGSGRCRERAGSSSFASTVRWSPSSTRAGSRATSSERGDARTGSHGWRPSSNFVDGRPPAILGPRTPALGYPLRHFPVHCRKEKGHRRFRCSVAFSRSLQPDRRRARKNSREGRGDTKRGRGERKFESSRISLQRTTGEMRTDCHSEGGAPGISTRAGSPAPTEESTCPCLFPAHPSRTRPFTPLHRGRSSRGRTARAGSWSARATRAGE